MLDNFASHSALMPFIFAVIYKINVGIGGGLEVVFDAIAKNVKSRIYKLSLAHTDDHNRLTTKRFPPQLIIITATMEPFT